MMRMKFTTEELRALTILEKLPEWQLAWFCDHGEKIELAPKERLFQRGDPADFMFIVVTGAIQGYEEIGGEWLVVATTRRGQVTGMLPYSRMTHYPRHCIAAEPSQVLRIKQSDFQEMLVVSQEIGQRLVAEMSDRVRGDVRHEQQREKMIALGKLSAGLAHELNNPAAAVSRAAANLSEKLEQVRALFAGMVRLGLGETEIHAADEMRALAGERDPGVLSPLERSEREDNLSAWLEDRGFESSWEMAPTFADAGLTVDDLEKFAGNIPEPLIRDAIAWVEGELGASRMVEEISSAAGRISELIASVKTYSHMDRSSEHQPTDVREGLDNTLTMLGHKIKEKGIRLARDYQEDLPTIPANGGELNQVWTNLIDNAVDAMGDGGELRIEVEGDDSDVDVRIIDNGPGIPDDIQHRIFEPFFTTKGVGEGTGLGLDIALRIVKTHQGQIDVQSTPGRTQVCVRLPFAPSSLMDESQGA
jgi:signal transduction histidine kinase